MRSTEIRLVAALLEQEADDVEDLAARVIQALDEDRTKRASFVIRTSLGGWVFGIGPFPSKAAAKAGLREINPTLVDPDRYVAQLIRPNYLSSATGHNSAFCVECQHPMSAHDWPKLKVAGCVVGYKAGNPRAGCQCGR